MSETTVASRKLTGFLSSGRFSWLLLLTIASFYAYSLLVDIVNPPDINSIVVINMTSQNVEFPLHVSMITDSKRWDRVFETGRLLGREMAKNGGVSTLRWDAPFMLGTVEISDGNGVVVARDTIRPRARYSGSLVIQLQPEGQVKSAFNELPL